MPTMKGCHPCCGYYLAGGTRIICILNMVGNFIGYVVLLADMIEPWSRLCNNSTELLMIFMWTTFWILEAIAMTVNVLLFNYHRSQNESGLARWTIVIAITSTSTIILYHFKFFYFNLYWEGEYLLRNYFLGNGAYIYRCYSCFVMYNYIIEIRTGKENLHEKLRGLTKAEISEFEEGIHDAVLNMTTLVAGVVDPSLSNSSHQMDIHSKIRYQKYLKEKYEIPLDKLTIDESQVLGSGAFGKVLKCHYCEDNSPTVVAVKTVDDDSINVHAFKAILSEVKVMCYLGNHENVVEFLGASTSTIQQKKLYIVMEFCPNGSLFDFLKSRKPLFFPHISSNNSSVNCDDYICDSDMVEDAIFTKDLIKWSYQIADGMAYLEQKKVVHGDLAARNILLNAEKIAKITDFGLSRQIYQYEVYMKKGNSPLPWRWLALESMTDMAFSSKSDVWAYGITVWEMFSLCDIPYSTHEFHPTFVQKLKNGMRLPIPINCPQEIYHILKQCWYMEPARRPSFSNLGTCFRNIISNYL